MNNAIKTYAQAIRATKRNSSETTSIPHPALTRLLTTLATDTKPAYDPDRVAFGMPTYTVLKNSNPIGYIEVKNFDFSPMELATDGKVQKHRSSLANLLVTNHIDFEWYVDGEWFASASIPHDDDKREETRGIFSLSELLTHFLNGQRPIDSPAAVAGEIAFIGRRMSKRLSEIFRQRRAKKSLKAQLQWVRRAHPQPLKAGDLIDVYVQSLLIGLLTTKVRGNDTVRSAATSIHERTVSLSLLSHGFLYRVCAPNLPLNVKELMQEATAVLDRVNLQSIADDTVTTDLFEQLKLGILQAYYPPTRPSGSAPTTPRDNRKDSQSQFDNFPENKERDRDVTPSDRQAAPQHQTRAHDKTSTIEKKYSEPAIVEETSSISPPAQPETDSPPETLSSEVNTDTPSDKNIITPDTSTNVKQSVDFHSPADDLRTPPPNASYISWQQWIASLSSRELQVVRLRYGVENNHLMTLKEVGEAISGETVSRERVRQIEANALQTLFSPRMRPFWQPWRELLSSALKQYGGLVTKQQWSIMVEENVDWPTDIPRPYLLQLLCAGLSEYAYLDKYEVATAGHITTAHMTTLTKEIKHVLRKNRRKECSPAVLAHRVKVNLPDTPTELREQAFILAATGLLKRVARTKSGYIYRRKVKKSRYASADLDWLGKENSQLRKWEIKLRQDFEQVDWIGQLKFTETEFNQLSEIIRDEAVNVNNKIGRPDENPRLLPAAVFITSMVFSARYALQTEDEVTDEFWKPYLRTVWEREYTQAFMARCRKRFVEVIPYLEEKFNFTFPRETEGDLVRTVYRHALIPAYMQDDFVRWMKANWQEVMDIADSQDQLTQFLERDSSLEHYYSRRFKDFVQGGNTADAAAALINNIATAMELHVNEGESLDQIARLMSDLPIEQELWQQIAGTFEEESTKQEVEKRRRQQRPRIGWVWIIEDGEMSLRVQNWTIAPREGIRGEPHSIVWLPTGETDPLMAEIEVGIRPWRTREGLWSIRDVLIDELEMKADGELVLLSDYDELLARQPVPELPNDDVQFFRLSQQGAFGIPVPHSRVKDGVWAICATEPATFVDEDGDQIPVDEELHVPYPLDERYRWAAEIELEVPLRVEMNGRSALQLMEAEKGPAVQATVSGSGQLKGLSRRLPPVFNKHDLVIAVTATEPLPLSRTAVWLEGRDGWEKKCLLTDLMVSTDEDGVMHVDLHALIPADRADLYTLQLRQALQPILEAPLEFALIPGLQIISAPTADDPIYTPANPPSAVLAGINADQIVRRTHSDISIEEAPDDQISITWHDLRHPPHLMLSMPSGVELPLEWPATRLTVWLKSVPLKTVLTPTELQNGRLRAVCTDKTVDSFTLSIAGEKRQYKLRRGRHRSSLNEDHLVSIIRQSDYAQMTLNVVAADQRWTLAEIKKRPSLADFSVEYDAQDHAIIITTGLQDNWQGQVEFIIESFSNPFAPPTILPERSTLENTDILHLPDDLPDGKYNLRLKLDRLPTQLDQAKTAFRIGKTADAWELEDKIIQVIRSEEILHGDLADDAIDWLADLQARKGIKLTAANIFQLSAIPTKSLAPFRTNDLKQLWSPLVNLREVSKNEKWVDQYGLLPAWLTQTHPIYLKRESRPALKVYPVAVANGGMRGNGYGKWRLSTQDNASKVDVWVSWRPKNDQEVEFIAGVPEIEPSNGNWATLLFDATYPLYVCQQCGWLVGARQKFLPIPLETEHKHGRGRTRLKRLSFEEHALVATTFPDRGEHLSQILEEEDVRSVPIPTSLKEPSFPPSDTIDNERIRKHTAVLQRQLRNMGESYTKEWPMWAAAARLLNHWREQESTTSFGQACFALSVLLRTGAYQQDLFHRLRKEATLAEKDLHELLAHLDQHAQPHLEWALTWAELLYTHAPRPTHI